VPVPKRNLNMKIARLQKEKLFGTDGIRGTPGEYPLTDEMLSKIGTGIARYLGTGSDWPNNDVAFRSLSLKKKVVIAKDTRLSGSKIETLLADSIKKWGIDVLLAGIITTPGLSFLTQNLKADMGIMISASHNKASDNGIKFFNSKGHKLFCKEEEEIENIIFDALTHRVQKHRSANQGKTKIIKNGQSKYVKFLISTLNGINLKGMQVALDCAFGAASPFAKKLFTKLGAKVYCINDTAQGENINIGGAIAPGFLKALVLKTKADLGVAVDGDGDRGILVDEKGRVLDGDYVLAIIGKYLIKKKKLPKNTIVGTVMSNYGLRVAIEENGGKIITANVGDKYVLEELLKHKLNLGGEQSGHIIFLEHLSTPDGLLTALQILKVMKEAKATLSELCKCITKCPQILVNIKVREKRPFEDMPLVARKLSEFTEQLKKEGRILLRYSGTENLARVMVEGKSRELIENIAGSLAEQIRKEIGTETRDCPSRTDKGNSPQGTVPKKVGNL
jgi:phosphoglucosamine mutase